MRLDNLAGLAPAKSAYAPTLRTCQGLKWYVSGFSPRSRPSPKFRLYFISSIPKETKNREAIWPAVLSVSCIAEQVK